jgi:hypothetical protein
VGQPASRNNLRCCERGGDPAMKTKVAISHEYNADFIGVGRRIAKGDPPPWLLIGLDQLSTGIADKGEDMAGIIERMDDAAEVLLKFLPAFERLPAGLQCPSDVALVLYGLPKIRKDLARLRQSKQGRRPVVGREICAAVIVEAWKIIHGKAEPRSLQLQQACDDYWRACGGAPIGDVENWRRSVERALATDHSWVRSILLAVQNAN